MLERSFPNLTPAKRFPDTFGDQLQGFTTSLKRQGYADRTVRQKLQLLTDCGQWLGRHNLAVTKLDDQLLETFLKHRKLPVQNGDPRTLQQFLDHLRRQAVVRTRHLPRERSPLAQILREYEKHLSLERGLLVNTILQYFLPVPVSKRRSKSRFGRRSAQGGELAAIHRAQVSGSGRRRTCAQVLRPSYGDRSPQLCHPSSTCPSRSSRWRSGCSPARGHQLESWRNPRSRQGVISRPDAPLCGCR